MKSFILLLVFLAAKVLPSEEKYDFRKDCGRRPLFGPPTNTSIVTWEDAEAGAWPWQVSIQNDAGHACGGAIVHPEWVLTSASCLHYLQESVTLTGARVVAGLTVLSQYDHAQTRSYIDYLPPDRYDSTPEYDFMILRMNSSWIFDDYIQPICLPLDGWDKADQTHCFITGWMHSDRSQLYWGTVLQNAQVMEIDDERCELEFGEKVFTNNSSCFSLLEVGINASQGDAGGPLQCYFAESERFYLLGVGGDTKWFGAQGAPGIYTSATIYTAIVHHLMTLLEELQNQCEGSKSSTSLVLVLLGAVFMLLHVWQ